MANRYWVGSNVAVRNDYEVYLSQTVVSWDELFQLYPISNMQGWGDNTYYQIGDGTTTQRNSPVTIAQSQKWKSITAGSLTSWGITSTNTLYSWGNNSQNQLGRAGATSNVLQVGSDNDWLTISGDTHCLAIKSNNSLWVWGYNQFGQCGLGTSGGGTNPTSPTVLTSLGNVWISAEAGNGWSCAITAAGSLYTWGINTTGMLGLGDTTNRSTPTLVSSNWLQVSPGHIDHTLAIKRDNTLWAWGSNDSGQLGNGTTVNTSTPVQIGNDSTWVAVSAGWKFSLALKSDGSLWAWGDNQYGQLGLGFGLLGVNQSSPMQVGAFYDWRQVRAGYQHGMAIRSNGSLWAWGWNSKGQLGLGSTTPVRSPVQVGTLTNWKQVSCWQDTTMSTLWPTTPSS